MRPARPFALLLTATLLVLLGVLWTSLRGDAGFLGRLLWISGAAVFLLFLVRTAGEIRFLILHLRSFSEPGLTVTLLLLAALLVLGAVALQRSGLRWDLTRGRVHSLSPGSQEVVDAIDRDAEIIAFLRDETLDWNEAGELLETFAAASRRLSARRVDPEKDPETARRYGVTEMGVILIRGLEREERVNELSERAVAAGLLRLATGRGKVIRFSRGHEERALRSRERDGLSKLVRFLQEDGYQVDTIDLLRREQYPEPPGQIILAGPRHDLLPAEIGALFDYLDQGGRVAIFVDPGVETELGQSLRLRGVRLGEGRLAPADAQVLGLRLGEEEVLAEPSPDHPASAGLRTRALLRGARPVAPATAGGVLGESTVLLTTFAGSSPDAAQPVAVAAAWQIPVEGEDYRALRTRPWARLIVMGDSDILTNGRLELQGNRQVVLSFVHWLAQEDLLLRTEAVEAPAPALFADAALRTLWLVAMVLLPLVLLLLSLFMWLRRRGQSG
ncbi:MAG: DUF4350 domain-containing protein [Candidatus Eisenbacteria bacterium]|nr:DUF4350 domain-containing protein [Candidatus Eisenbacteria bacterium]